MAEFGNRAMLFVQNKSAQKFMIFESLPDTYFYMYDVSCNLFERRLLFVNLNGEEIQAYQLQAMHAI